MIKSGLSITEVKSDIEKMQSKDVEVTVNLGRNKFVTYMGKLNGVYPALFTVNPFDKEFKGKTSYSYSELLCGKVLIKEMTNATV